MPIYEFQCSACSRVSEHIMKISDNTPEACPCCQKKNSLTKLMSRTSFVLKGQGWYETDFKGKQKNSSASNTTSSTPVSPLKSSESSEGATISADTSTSKNSSSPSEK